MISVDVGVLYGSAFVLALCATLVLTPAAARVARSLGLLDQPGGHKGHTHATPYLGGLAVGAGLLVAGMLIGRSETQVLAIGGGAIVVSILGLVDDWRTVRPAAKIAVEAAAAVALWAAGVRAGLFGVPALDLALTIAWVVVITNAINLVDNMDGVASGLAAIASLAYLAIAATEGEYLVSMYAAALAGASLGFLRHNFPPARIFLGDAGSLLMGFLLAALALKLDLVSEGGVVRAAIPALILGVPVFDTILVVLSRRREGRPVFLGSTDHSSHRLARRGLSSRRVAVVLYLSQLGSSSMGLWLLYTPRARGLSVLALVAIAGAGLGWLLAFRPSTVGGPAARTDTVPVGVGVRIDRS